MSDFLKGKVAVITGASRGLGKAMALALAAEGVHIALVARDQAKLEEVSSAIGDLGAESAVFVADVTDEAAVAAVEQGVARRFGYAQILVNNAGMNIRKNTTEFTLEEWRRVLDTNLTSAFLLSRAFIPQMKGTGYGRILNLTSIMAHVSLPGRAAYSATKAGLLGMTKAMAMELAPEGICVVGISPGPFLTEMNLPLVNDPVANAQFLQSIPVGRWGQVQDIGQLAVYLCSEHAGFITGCDILIDGGWTAR